MSHINEKYIEDYIRGTIPEHRGYLKDIEDYAKDHHIPIIEREVAQLLEIILKIKNPRRILEIGTAIGYSALTMARATDVDCHITTIERRKDLVEIAEGNIANADFSGKIKILKGEAETLLGNIDGNYDFIFLDAAKGQYLEFFKACMNLLNTNGIIMTDNVLFKGMVASEKLVIRRKKTIVKRLREYIRYINGIKGYQSCIIPIGDGVALTYREE